MMVSGQGHVVIVLLLLASLILGTAVAEDKHWDRSIYVSGVNGSDSAACLSGNQAVACATLEYVMNRMTNSTRVVLLSEIHTLTRSLVVSNVNDIALVGTHGNSMSVVRCAPENITAGAGLKFVGVSNFYVNGVMFEKCGSLLESTTKESNERASLFRAAVYLLNSTNVMFHSVSFNSNMGTGLVLYDVNGQVTITDSIFTKNAVPVHEIEERNGGGGLYIEHTYCTPGQFEDSDTHCDFFNNPYSNGSVYNISDCTFVENRGTSLAHRINIIVHQEKSNPNRLGSGGGIGITLKGASSENTFFITDCHFSRNSAVFGGGLSIHLHDQATNNSLLVRDCTFQENSADFGGGGFSMGLFFYDYFHVSGTVAIFERVNTTGNSAVFGGGTEIISSRSKQVELVTNLFTFSECVWAKNNASLAAALLLTPEPWNSFTDGYLPTPVFKNCHFLENRIEKMKISGDDYHSQSTEGVLFSSTFSMNFSSLVNFFGNVGTALSINAGSINILENTTAIFEQNVGTQGGAIALLEFAHLQVFPKSRLTFENNRAYDLGGAIYVAITDELDFYYSRSCFIRYYDVRIPVKDWDTRIIFRNNYAGALPPLKTHTSIFFDPSSAGQSQDQGGETGHSIYSVSILPCVRAADTTGNGTLSQAQFFPSSPFFFAQPYYNQIVHIATAPAHAEINPAELEPDGVLKLIPGEARNISLIVRDELDNNVDYVFAAYVSRVEPRGSVEVDKTSLFVTNNTVQVNGEIGANFHLNLRTVGRKKIITSVNATLTNCPPGLVYYPRESSTPSNVYLVLNKAHGRCICSATTSDQQYDGITKCSTEGSNALLDKGFWAGCDETGAVLTAECPLGYCHSQYNTRGKEKPFYVLPKTCDEVETFLCGPQNRRGVLCGECAPNLTVLYHSQRFLCSKCKTGHIGWLLYIVSELLPVTFVFLLVVALNIHLTSGMWNSAILFAQIVDLFEISSLELYALPKGVSELTNIYHFIYAFFNLDFFKYEDKLAFCLWDGATVLHVLVFKYITTTFAFLLLLFLVLCFKSQCWQKCWHIWKRCQASIGNGLNGTRHRSWVIHGISAFLVLSYAHCAKVSLQILTWSNPRGEGKIIADKVVFLSGNVKYFGVKHLPYALPALFVLILTLIPPVVLLVYPTVTRILGESLSDKLTPKFCRIQLTRIKPLIDSFEGCYKDNCRFFAGLLFLYRFGISAIFALTTNAVQLYICLEIALVVILAIHAIFQPNQVPFYNIVDTLMIANLAIINGLTLFNYYWSVYLSADRNVTIALWFQLVFLYLPILYMGVMAMLTISTSISRRARRTYVLRKLNTYIPMFEEDPADQPLAMSVHSEAEDENAFPYRLIEEERQAKQKRLQTQLPMTTY